MSSHLGKVNKIEDPVEIQSKIKNILDMYDTINWTSNIYQTKGKGQEKTAVKWGGIIGSESQIKEYMFRPGYSGEYFYIHFPLQPKERLNLLEKLVTCTKLNRESRKTCNIMLLLKKTNSPISGQPLTLDHTNNILENSIWKDKLSGTMPPIVQPKGGLILPTAVEYLNFQEMPTANTTQIPIFTEWGFFMGQINDIKKNLQNIQIRFSPYVLESSRYISESDILFYIAGCLYYNMTKQQVKQEIVNVFQKSQHHDRFALTNNLIDKYFSVARQETNFLTPTLMNFDLSPIPSEPGLPENNMSNLDEFFAGFGDNFNQQENGIRKLQESEIDELLGNDKIFSYYPAISDENFECRLSQKNEFYSLRQEPIAGKTMKGMCPQNNFPKLKSQELVRNFMRPETPYTGILVYHGVGTGKTCLSIQVAEAFKPLIRKLGKRVLVVVSKSIEENYKKELYNFKNEQKETKLKLERGTLQCTGTTYIPPPNMTQANRIKYVNKMIENYYEIVTYQSIKALFYKCAHETLFRIDMGEKGMVFLPDRNSFGVEEARACCKSLIFLARLQQEFSDRLFIIDEVHNMRESSDSEEKTSSQILELILQNCERIKLVLLTATPIYNSTADILYLLNLLLLNDRSENGKKNLKLLADIKTHLFDEQKLDFKDPEMEADFKKLWKGRLSYVRGENPVNFPEKRFPPSNLVYRPPWRHINNPKSNNFYLDLITELNPPYPLTLAQMSSIQKVVYEKIVGFSGARNQADIEVNTKSNETFHLNGKDISNLVFPSQQYVGEQTHKSVVEAMFGRKGFDNCFKIDNGYYIPTSHCFVKKEPEQKEIFFLDASVLENYSPKMKIILQQIIDNPNQLIFVYGEHRKSTLFPFCMMLERNGFDRYSHRNFLDKGAMLGRKERRKKYIFIDGSVQTEERNRLVNYFNDPSNKEGQNVQVMIGTKVLGEGVDFKNIRQIHIFNPWYNMSRIDQIVGRGIRHCSHLDFSKDEERDYRSVTVFLYSASLYDKSIREDKRQIPVETTDESLFRMAFRKDILFQRIFRSLKEIAIDCNLNYEMNVFEQDKHDSRECAYKKCHYKCAKDCTYSENNINYDTYSHTLNEEGVKKMKKVILNTMKTFGKRAFTISELLKFSEIPLLDDKLNLFKFCLISLIFENKILYNSGQYVLIPNKYLDYKDKGLEYILYDSILMPPHKSFQLPNSSELYVTAENKNIQSAYEKQEIINNDISQWFNEKKKTLVTLNEIFSSIDRDMQILDSEFMNQDFEISNIPSKNLTILRILMNEEPVNDILYYTKNACVKNNIKQYQKAFSFIDVQEGGYCRFFNLNKKEKILYQYRSDGKRNKNLYSFEKNPNTLQLNEFLKEYKAKSKQKENRLIPILSQQIVSPPDVIHGYIYLKGPNYRFNIVEPVVSSHGKSPIINPGIACSSIDINRKKIYIGSLIKKYIYVKHYTRNQPIAALQEIYSNITRNISTQLDDLKSNVLCIVIQYLLFQLNVTDPKGIYIYEKDEFQVQLL
jgi:hypothetical protein